MIALIDTSKIDLIFTEDEVISEWDFNFTGH